MTPELTPREVEVPKRTAVGATIKGEGIQRPKS